jgi:hypothetical protein
MRSAWLRALLVLAATGVDGADFTLLPPHAIAGLAGWEVLAGELEPPGLAAGYRFYVNPARPALYTIMRYRLRAGGKGTAPTEKFVWVERPGEPVPLRCFEVVPPIPPGTKPSWREMRPGTQEYMREMQTVVAVLGARQRQEAKRAEQAAKEAGAR